MRVAGMALAVVVWVAPGWGQNVTGTDGAAAPSTSKAAEPAKQVADKYDVGKIGNRNVGGGVNFYSLEREVALGRQLAAQVDQYSKFVTDPEVTEYVNRIGQNIVRNSDAKVPFTIKVIDDDTVNAFALPGGFFYVDSGLILAADNEAELAGVMAHEIAHVAARHATRNATKGEILNLASIPLIFVGGAAGYAVRSVAGLAVPLSFLKFSRSAEREADLLGLEYQYASGYDPEAFVQFFERLEANEKKKHGFLARTFSTHPMTAARVKAAQEEIAKYLPDRPQYVVTTSEFDEVKARLSGIINAHRINNGNEARPTLRQRPGSEKVDTAQTDTAGSSGDKSGSDDDQRPTLKRRSGSDASGTTRPQTDTGSNAPTSSDDEQRPTLKRAPQ
ncbi:MAG: M48 family metalloprotease [Acidobacteriia bacterium]|nr:M48 family metalloprotease [Terriglobia bacterium]